MQHIPRYRQSAHVVRRAALPRLLQDVQRRYSDVKESGAEGREVPDMRDPHLCRLHVLRLVGARPLQYEVSLSRDHFRVSVRADQRRRHVCHVLHHVFQIAGAMVVL